MTERTIPSFFRAYCPSCEAGREYEPAAGDTDRLVAVYECRMCGHRAELRLDP